MTSFKKNLERVRRFFKCNLSASITLLMFCLSLSNANAATSTTTRHTVHHRHHVTHKVVAHQQTNTTTRHRLTQRHKRSRIHHPATTVSDDSPALFAAAVPAYYNKPDYVIPVPATSSQKRTVNQKNMVTLVDKTVSTLHYSDYKMGGHKYDPLHGVYVLDCSNFVDHILQNASPMAYSRLVNATGSDTPSTQHFYDFFRDLNNEPTDLWNKVNSVEQLRAGDILVFRDKHGRGHRAGGGHVMVVMDTPTHNTNVFFVRVADSAPAPHSQDTRQSHEAGIGIGTLLLKVNPITGLPNAYAWGMGGFWKNNVNFAMARPLDVSDITGV